MSKIADLIIPILKEKPLEHKELITKINQELISQSVELPIDKIEKSVKKLIGKKIYQWRNGYYSLKKSPNTEDLEQFSSIPEIDKAFCQTYYEDLITLKNWNNSVNEVMMRQMSPIVRRILVENDLQKLWKHLGFYKQPKIGIPILDEYFERINPDKITILSAGGATHNGITVERTMILNYVLKEDEVKKLSSKKEVTKKMLTLNDFMDSICLVIEGEKISRRDLIKYIANKLGGNHFDSSRKVIEQENRELIEKYEKLDRIEKVKLTDLKTVYFELLSIVQCLFLSEDILKLISKIEEVISPQ